ncbi:hypothetical protein [Fimbriimonas ginsengisoli]|uniref:Uncharacterized protein n=1 Tax=Fimbriimonas ginsengisoli Gsoil 348 TaxID=661478 RepID=A0A068NJC2_FIMGI|nr:hypothetical protein [Fimbriimonas ginsengisoli]AIE83713.1 hypothetical protein OP10G_0345 [Fimbriimonas ginsengisoli Gsoil 348]
MLCVNKYEKEYVAQCRSLMESQLAAYRQLPSEGTFETLFLNNLVLALDRMFVHRTRSLEGKDGNPLNEVRMMCNSILESQGVMTADKTIKYNPAKSVLGIELGKAIKLTEPEFERLSQAFFAEIGAKFT